MPVSVGEVLVVRVLVFALVRSTVQRMFPTTRSVRPPVTTTVDRNGYVNVVRPVEWFRPLAMEYSGHE